MEGNVETGFWCSAPPALGFLVSRGRTSDLEPRSSAQDILGCGEHMSIQKRDI